MTKKKTLKELTIKNNFMFAAVMCDENNCKQLLELVLQIPIEHVEVSKEKSIVYHPEYKGIRLDVFAKDENHTHYNVEMQSVQKQAIGKRARYYHSQIDMELLLSGREYAELPNSYVIFVCDFDPFGQKKYCYSFANQCLEDSKLNLSDGSRSIFLSTSGNNDADVPERLVKFLKFVKADLKDCDKDYEDDFVRTLQKTVQHIKESREMEERFMVFELLLKDERAEGKAEGKAEDVLELLEELGTISSDLREKIMSETDLKILVKWLKLAAKVDSIEQFLQNM